MALRFFKENPHHMKVRIYRRFLAMTKVKFSVLTIQDAKKGPLKCSNLQFCGSQNVNCGHSETGEREQSFCLQMSSTCGLFVIFFLVCCLCFSTCCQKHCNIPEALVLKVF